MYTCNVLAEGWAIIWGPETNKPGWVELDYFNMKEFRRPTMYAGSRRIPGGVISLEEWCKMYRPDCKIIRVQVMEKTND